MRVCPAPHAGMPAAAAPPASPYDVPFFTNALGPHGDGAVLGGMAPYPFPSSATSALPRRPDLPPVNPQLPVVNCEKGKARTPRAADAPSPKRRGGKKTDREEEADGGAGDTSSPRYVRHGLRQLISDLVKDRFHRQWLTGRKGAFNQWTNALLIPLWSQMCVWFPAYCSAGDIGPRGVVQEHRRIKQAEPIPAEAIVEGVCACTGVSTLLWECA